MILVLARPSERKGLVALARQFGKGVVTVSDVRGVGDVWFMKRLYRELDRGAASRMLPEELVDDVRLRCRYLRILRRDEAERLIAAARSACHSVIDEYEPETIVGGIADYYINDLFYRVALEEGIPLVTLAPSFMPGYSVITVWGEHHRLREVDDEEVDRVVEHLSTPFHRANYAVSREYGFRTHVWGILRHLAAATGKEVQKVIYRDPLNFHFNSWRVRAHSTPAGYFTKRYWVSEWETRLDRDKPTVLIPLAYIPEATTDYWCIDRAAADYETMVSALLVRLKDGFNVVVKEHVHMAGMRPLAFYDQLRAIPDVILVPPAAYLTEMIDRADVLVVGGGTAGLEAMVRGKPVITYCDSYWSSSSWARKVRSLDVTSALVTDWMNADRRGGGSGGTADWARKAVRCAMSSTTRGSPLLARSDIAARLDHHARLVFDDVAVAIERDRSVFTSARNPLSREHLFDAGATMSNCE